jgi:hypothetical protein
VAHELRLSRVDDQLLGDAFHIVTQHRHAAAVLALALEGGDLVADTLADDLELELSERKQDVKRQTPH